MLFYFLVLVLLASNCNAAINLFDNSLNEIGPRYDSGGPYGAATGLDNNPEVWVILHFKSLPDIPPEVMSVLQNTMVSDAKEQKSLDLFSKPSFIPQQRLTKRLSRRMKPTVIGIPFRFWPEQSDVMARKQRNAPFPMFQALPSNGPFSLFPNFQNGIRSPRLHFPVNHPSEHLNTPMEFPSQSPFDQHFNGFPPSSGLHGADNSMINVRMTIDPSMLPLGANQINQGFPLNSYSDAFPNYR